MTEGGATAPAAAKKEEKKTRVRKARVLTFVYSASDEGVDVVCHRTNAFSLEEAWSECVKKQGLENVKMHGAIAGEHGWMKKELRKPTYEELAKMCNIR